MMQLRLFAPVDPEIPRRWLTGPFDRTGAPFAHIVRHEGDPERKDRAPSQALAWRVDLKGDGQPWREAITALLGDGRPRTFNALLLEITDGRYTADVGYMNSPDKALWELVTDGVLEHTAEAPIFFRLRDP